MAKKKQPSSHLRGLRIVGEDYDRIEAEFTYLNQWRSPGPSLLTQVGLRQLTPGERVRLSQGERARFVSVSEFLASIESGVRSQLREQGYPETLEALGVDKDLYEGRVGGTVNYIASEVDFDNTPRHPIPVSDLVCCLIHIETARRLIHEGDLEGLAAVCYFLGQSAWRAHVRLRESASRTQAAEKKKRFTGDEYKTLLSIYREVDSNHPDWTKKRKYEEVRRLAPSLHASDRTLRRVMKNP